ncbi:TadE/TadG family type IV pilus assembly protein [Micropruina sp.]|uniref:TadE/TadG family type IV pilus assembly protein n=1 Tax=Micropruina sp. TaxID=2737536 RepID=UPI0039E4A586
MRRPRGERGAAAVEFAVIVPALALLIGLIIGAGRVWHGHTVVEQIAGVASRAASLASTPAEAKVAAQRIAGAQAATSGLNCRALGVEIDVSGFQVPVGQPAQVRVRVSCGVPLADLAVPGWPGEWQLSADGSSALDRYRRRG